MITSTLIEILTKEKLHEICKYWQNENFFIWILNKCSVTSEDDFGIFENECFCMDCDDIALTWYKGWKVLS